MKTKLIISALFFINSSISFSSQSSFESLFDVGTSLRKSLISEDEAILKIIEIRKNNEFQSDEAEYLSNLSEKQSLKFKNFVKEMEVRPIDNDTSYMSSSTLNSSQQKTTAFSLESFDEKAAVNNGDFSNKTYALLVTAIVVTLAVWAKDKKITFSLMRF
jgi:hypothetical protein